MPHKLTLFLMTEKGFDVLRALIEQNLTSEMSVIVGQDSALESDHSLNIMGLCREHGIEAVYRSEFKGHVTSDYAIAVSWRWLIQFPEDRLIILHDSLLPAFRGFAPLPNALIKGDREIGVTALFGAREYDRGPILLQKSVSISYPIKICDAISLLADLYADITCALCKRIVAGETLVGIPQDEEGASYSIWRDAKDYQIDWTWSAARIHRMIDAVGPPYAGAYTSADGNIVRLLDVEEKPDVLCELRHVGKVIFVEDGHPIVICGSGLLKINEAYIEQDGNREPFLPLKRFRTRFE